MNSSPVTIWKSSGRFGRIMIWTACAISVIALSYIGYVLRAFYLATADLAPGTGIRPMGVTFHLMVTGIAGLFLAGACALVGGFLGALQRRWKQVSFAVLAACFSLIPLFVATKGFDHIVTLRQLVLKD
jgi:hypothetical protein